MRDGQAGAGKGNTQAPKGGRQEPQIRADGTRDAPAFDGLLDQALAKVPGTKEVAADRGYGSWAIRMRLVDEWDIGAQIPNKSNAVEP